MLGLDLGLSDPRGRQLLVRPRRPAARPGHLRVQLIGQEKVLNRPTHGPILTD